MILDLIMLTNSLSKEVFFPKMTMYFFSHLLINQQETTVLITYPQIRASNEHDQLISNKAGGQECSLDPLCMCEHEMLGLSPKLGRPMAPKSTLCMLGILHDFYRRLIKINFLKISFRYTIRVSISLNPNKTGLIWFPTVCKSYQLTTLVGKELVCSMIASWICFRE